MTNSGRQKSQLELLQDGIKDLEEASATWIMYGGGAFLLFLFGCFLWVLCFPLPNSGSNYAQTQADKRDALAREQELRTERYLHSQQELKKAIDYVNATE